MAAVRDRAPRDVAMEVRIDQGLRAREEPSTTSGWANGRQTRLGSNEGSPWTGGGGKLEGRYLWEGPKGYKQSATT